MPATAQQQRAIVAQLDQMAIAAALRDTAPVVRKARRTLEPALKTAAKYADVEDEQGREFVEKVQRLAEHLDAAVAFFAELEQGS